MIILYIFLVILAAMLPSFIWLLFFLKEDIHPEPKRLIIYTFSIGALASLPVLAAQLIFRSFALQFESAILLIFGFALIEEVFKFFAVYFAVHKDPSFDEPIDAMIYMVAGALGFAMIENLFIMQGTLDSVGFFNLSSVLNTLLLRFVGATLLHTLASAVVGYYWARGILLKDLAIFLIIGLTFATVAHSIFNYLVLRFEGSSLLYPTLFLISTAFFVLNDFEKLKVRAPV